MKTKLITTLMASAAMLAGAASAQTMEDTIAAVKAHAEKVNAHLEAEGANYRLEYADILVGADSGEEATTVFFNNRGNKQLTVQFMENDTRRVWSGGDPNTIDWTLDGVDTTSDVGVNAQQSAIVSAMQSWDDVKCSDLGLNGSLVGQDQGYVEAIFGLGGGFFITGDLMFSGFLPGQFMGPNTLGVHYGFNFIDENRQPTDLNNDGFADKAFGDMYFNDNFRWSTDGSGVDIETVALHEAGHGLNQQHFGKGFRTEENGKLHFAPRAVMNATYFGAFRDLKGTDKGGHCSMWAAWPNN